MSFNSGLAWNLHNRTNRSFCPLTSTWVLFIRPLRFHEPVRCRGCRQSRGRVTICQCAESTQHTFADTSTTHALPIPQYPNTTTSTAATATTPAGIQSLHAAHAEPNAVYSAGARARRGSVAANGTTTDDAHTHPDARTTAATECGRTE